MQVLAGRPPAGVTLENRFWQRVKKTRGCWNWIGYSANGRYGHLKDGSKRLCAHVLSYEMHKGKVPVGLKILHKCDNGFCVNPNHLFLGTQKDNAQDMLRKGRSHDRSAAATKQWERWREARKTKD